MLLNKYILSTSNSFLGTYSTWKDKFSLQLQWHCGIAKCLLVAHFRISADAVHHPGIVHWLCHEYWVFGYPTRLTYSFLHSVEQGSTFLRTQGEGGMSALNARRLSGWFVSIHEGAGKEHYLSMPHSLSAPHPDKTASFKRRHVTSGVWLCVQGRC